MRVVKTFCVITLIASLCAPAAQAQTRPLPAGTPLSQTLLGLYVLEIESNARVISSLTGEPYNFVLSRLLETDLPDALAITHAIGTQLSSFPLGSSAGGFAWTFDASAGTFTRSSTSFGPVFAERALTIGRGRFNFGVNYQHAGFDEFEGQSLRDREVLFYTPFPSGNVGEDALSLKLSTDTVGLFSTYGLTDRWDVGVAIPIVRVNLEADLRFRFLDPSGNQFGTFSYSLAGGGSASGIGDVVVRTKYNLWDSPGGGLAAGLDLRLPTGNEEELLGIPGTQGKLYAIWSTAYNKLSPHVNVGYTFSKGNARAADPTSVFLAPPDELNYVAGADFALTPRVTLVGDILGRRLNEMPRLDLVTLDLGPRFREFDFNGLSSMNLVLASAGAKWNAYGNLLVAGSVIFPLRQAGLRDQMSFVMGLDYSF